MSSDEPPGKVALQRALGELLYTPWQERIGTMLLTLGILTFGVMLGAHIMAADLLFGMRLPPLKPRYTRIMKIGTYVAGGSLVSAVALLNRGDADE